MDKQIQEFNQRLISIFESKAEEFNKYSEEEGNNAPVAAQIAGMYSELAQVMKS
jgi:hypothetical protein